MAVAGCVRCHTGVEFLPQNDNQFQKDSGLHGVKDNTGLLIVRVRKLRFHR